MTRRRPLQSMHFANSLKSGLVSRLVSVTMGGNSDRPTSPKIEPHS